MLRSPVKLLEDYNRAFNLETREKIWREVIKDLREEKNPSYALTALFPLSERPEAHSLPMTSFPWSGPLLEIKRFLRKQG